MVASMITSGFECCIKMLLWHNFWCYSLILIENSLRLSASLPLSLLRVKFNESTQKNVMRVTAPSMLSQSASINFAAWVLMMYDFWRSHVSKARLTNSWGLSNIYCLSDSVVLIIWKQTLRIKFGRYCRKTTLNCSYYVIQWFSSRSSIMKFEIVSSSMISCKSDRCPQMTSDCNTTGSKGWMPLITWWLSLAISVSHLLSLCLMMKLMHSRVRVLSKLI